MEPLQDELPSKLSHRVVPITLTQASVYRELQKSGRKSAGTKSKGSAATSVADPTSSMGPPQAIPKKGKGAAAIVPMSEGEDGNTQGELADADMDVDAETNDGEGGEEAEVIESQGEDEGEEEDGEEEDEDEVDQVMVEGEELRRDTKGLDLHDPQADMEEDV